MVQLYPWFNFYFPLFYTHYHTLPYTKTKENKNFILGSIILGSIFIFLCFILIIIHYHTQKQRKIKIEPRIKLSHNMCMLVLELEGLRDPVLG